MISLHRSMHSSQMYTPGPAISFLTCFCDLPQNEHFSSSPPSPNLATIQPRSGHSPWALTTKGHSFCPKCEAREADPREIPQSAGLDSDDSADRGGVVDRVAAREHLVDEAVFLGLLCR